MPTSFIFVGIVRMPVHKVLFPSLRDISARNTPFILYADPFAANYIKFISSPLQLRHHGALRASAIRVDFRPPCLLSHCDRNNVDHLCIEEAIDYIINTIIVLRSSHSLFPIDLKLCTLCALLAITLTLSPTYRNQCITRHDDVPHHSHQKSNKSRKSKKWLRPWPVVRERKRSGPRERAATR